MVQHNNSKMETEQNPTSLVEQLKSKVTCPMCYEVPKRTQNQLTNKRTPIPVCRNGHIVCQSCKRDNCPMCREPMPEGARSLLAAIIVENLMHNCDYTLYGCQVVQVKHANIVKHLDTCSYRFHSNGWNNLSAIAGIKLKAGGCFEDLGVKFSPVTIFYDCEGMVNSFGLAGEVDVWRKKVMWPPNAIEFDGTIFFLYIIADTCGRGRWQFIVKWGESDAKNLVNLPSLYTASIEVFKPGANSGCRRHFHMQRTTGRLDFKQQLILKLDNSQMKGLFLDKTVAVSVHLAL